MRATWVSGVTSCALPFSCGEGLFFSCFFKALRGGNHHNMGKKKKKGGGGGVGVADSETLCGKMPMASASEVSHEGETPVSFTACTPRSSPRFGQKSSRPNDQNRRDEWPRIMVGWRPLSDQESSQIGRA